VETCQDQAPQPHRKWLLKRNCSLTPRQLGLSYLLLCAVSFGVAAIWLMRGFWVMLAFSMLEMAGAAVAWFVHARHATDHECVTLTDSWLLVDQVDAGCNRAVRLDARRTRIIAPDCYGALIRLEAPDAKVAVGRHVWPGRRRQLADELRNALRAAI